MFSASEALRDALYKSITTTNTTTTAVDVQPRPQPNPALPSNGLHHRNVCNYMDCYSFADPKGMEG